MPEFQGNVDIVGAGPGSPDFLTVIGRDILAQAEILIYDALVHPKLLTLPKENCQFVSVGKRGGRQSPKQFEINEQLISACQTGKRVVRLKSGDPFIFGRTASEVEALRAAGCRVRVWPGLSSVFAAPLLAGFPLTDATVSQTVTIVSGHDPDELNWSAIAQSDTVVILMGTRNLTVLLQSLRSAGKSPETPVAIVKWCGWPEQQSWFGTVDTIAALIDSPSLSPAVVVVGQVVALRETLVLPNWLEHLRRMDKSQPPPIPTSSTQPFPVQAFVMTPSTPNPDADLETQSSRYPLLGKQIVVTRAAGQSSIFCDRLTSLGASVLEFPALEIVPPTSWTAVDQALQHLQNFQWLLLTSANAVEFFLQRLMAQGLDTRALSGIKIAVVGRKTAQALAKSGLKPDFIPENYVADSLLETFPNNQNLPGLSLLFPRVESGGRDILVREFRHRGAEVTEVAAYQSRCPLTIPSKVLSAFQAQRLDAITFASSKTVRHAIRLLNQASIQQGSNAAIDESSRESRSVNVFDTPTAAVQKWLSSVCIASIGPQTSKTCLELIGRADLEAKEYTLDGLAQSLTEFYGTHE